MSTIEARFKAQRSDFTLDIDLSVPARGITALFGASGSGKTTTLRCIAGLEPGIRGYFAIGDQRYQDDRLFVPAHRRGFGYVFQESSLFSHMNVEENLRYGYRRVRRNQQRLELEQVLFLLGIGSWLKRMPHALSGGERQRVAIARALLSSPRLLLLDEPLASLDLDSCAELLPWLDRLHESLEIPVLYISHAPAEIQRLADHLVLIEDGRVRASGPLSQMLTRVDLPLGHMEEAGAVLDARVISHDDRFHLTAVVVTGGNLTISRRDVAVGERLRVRILARDVSIALTPPTQTSISNILRARLLDLNPDRDPSQLVVRLDLGGVLLLSRITRSSAARLGLQPGMEVFAQVKSVAVM